MPGQTFHTHFNSPDETAEFAAKLAALLKPGDVVLLCGDLGAGKTHFARSLIQAILVTPEDVPSPTFTLVQVYDTTVGPVWHADLYRISSVFEIEELGLSDAFDTAVCLIEWPDRLADLTPSNALSVKLEMTKDEGERTLQAHWADPKWDTILREAGS